MDHNRQLPGSIPNLINIMGPFANALTGGNGPPPRGPPGLVQQHHPGLNEFHPPEKRIRR